MGAASFYVQGRRFSTPAVSASVRMRPVTGSVDETTGRLPPDSSAQRGGAEHCGNLLKMKYACRSERSCCQSHAPPRRVRTVSRTFPTSSRIDANWRDQPFVVSSILRSNLSSRPDPRGVAALCLPPRVDDRCRPPRQHHSPDIKPSEHYLFVAVRSPDDQHLTRRPRLRFCGTRTPLRGGPPQRSTGGPGAPPCCPARLGVPLR